MRRYFRLALVPALLCCPAAAADHLGKSLTAWQSELQSSERLDRLLAARAIGEMAVADDADAAVALVAALEHQDSAVRYWAAVAAGRMERWADRGRFENQLASGLEDSTPEVRIASAFALARLGAGERSQSAVRLLARELVDNRERGARLHAVYALDELGPRSAAAAPELEQALDDSFDYVKRIARHALWTLDKRPCPYQNCE